METEIRIEPVVTDENLEGITLFIPIIYAPSFVNILMSGLETDGVKFKMVPENRLIEMIFGAKAMVDNIMDTLRPISTTAQAMATIMAERGYAFVCRRCARIHPNEH